MTPDEPTLEELAAEPAESVVRTYLERWDAHDAEGMLALLGDGPMFWWGKSEIHAYRQGLLAIMAWESGAEVGIALRGLELEDEHTVRVSLERNYRPHRLLGLDPLVEELTFVVDDGIIETICWEFWPEEYEERYKSEYREALAPVIAWTRKHRPEEVDELFMGGEVFDNRGESLRGRHRRGRRQSLLVEDYLNAMEMAGLERDELYSVKWRRDPDGGGAAIVNAKRRDPETGELVRDNRRMGWCSLAELPETLAEIIREDGADKGVWRGAVAS